MELVLNVLFLVTGLKVEPRTPFANTIQRKLDTLLLLFRHFDLRGQEKDPLKG